MPTIARTRFNLKLEKQAQDRLHGRRLKTTGAGNIAPRDLPAMRHYVEDGPDEFSLRDRSSGRIDQRLDFKLPDIRRRPLPSKVSTLRHSTRE